jgi:predicted RNA binding protein YcfA (HicA-like mRNA interferase family)
MTNQKNVKFSDFATLLRAFGFILDRCSGSHHIYKHIAIPERINAQKKTAKQNRIKLINS